MAFQKTFPVILDDCFTLTIRKLKQWGFLEPESIVFNTFRINTDYGNYLIRLKSNLTEAVPYLELSYKIRGHPVSYKINLESVPSNLGKGLSWYLRCPATGVRCRTLHFIKAVFVHRTAAPNAYYEKEIVSHLYRKYEKMFAAVKAEDYEQGQFSEKSFTKYYKGKPTRKYKRVLNKLGAAERYLKNFEVSGNVP
ncbi:MAG: hypothetical protein HUU54_13360 [Ignavibacteriaceae bacterium]|nr:hypothetical protein [Ignavibacteriaceae bacterium]